MEEWRDIKGFEGYYQISNMGRVKILKRTVWNSGRGYYVTVPEKIRKAKKNNGGYLLVQLSKDGKRKYCLMHRLVAQAFLKNPMGYTEVNHIDENKENNCAENLEWCSRSYNVNYGTRNEKLSKAVIGINKISGLIVEFPPLSEATRQTGISHGNICECCNGKRKSAGGHIWFYADDNE